MALQTEETRPDAVKTPENVARAEARMLENREILDFINLHPEMLIPKDAVFIGSLNQKYAGFAAFYLTDRQFAWLGDIKGRILEESSTH